MIFNWRLDTDRKKGYLLIISVCLTFLVSYLQYRLPLKSFDGSPDMYTHYNNYIIFKLSHFHLLDNKNIYTFFNAEVHDLFKYSPAFALIFGIFGRLPDLLGLSLWNILNVVFLLSVLLKYKNLWTNKFIFLIIFITPELVLTTQHAQSNALMAGLILLAYLDFEENKSWRAGVWIVLAGFIKIYAGLAVFLFLLYDKKLNFLTSAFTSTIILLGLPLFVISPANLWMQYQGWWQLLAEDHGASSGLSLIQVIQLFFPQFGGKTFVQLVGVIILIAILIPIKKYIKAQKRHDYLTLILLTLIIYNHKSESATFIVAIVGIAIWYFSKSIPTKIETVLIILAFVFTVLSASDIFPPFIRNNYFVPYAIKVWPCILIYFYLIYSLFKNAVFTDNKSYNF